MTQIRPHRDRAGLVRGSHGAGDHGGARLGDDARIWRLSLANDSPSRQSDANTLLEYIVEEQQLRDVMRVVAAPAVGRGTRAPAGQHKFRASQPKCARDSADPRRRVRGAGRGHPFKPQSSSRRCFASRRPTCPEMRRQQEAAHSSNGPGRRQVLQRVVDEPTPEGCTSDKRRHH